MNPETFAQFLEASSSLHPVQKKFAKAVRIYRRSTRRLGRNLGEVAEAAGQAHPVIAAIPDLLESIPSHLLAPPDPAATDLKEMAARLERLAEALRAMRRSLTGLAKANRLLTALVETARELGHSVTIDDARAHLAEAAAKAELEDSDAGEEGTGED